MKKVVQSILLISIIFTSAYAQNNVYKLVGSDTSVFTIAPLQLKTDRSTAITQLQLSKRLQKYSLLSLTEDKNEQLSSLASLSPNGTFILTIPNGGSGTEIVLKENNIVTTDFSVNLSEGGRNNTPTLNKYYYGYIKGDENSIAAFAITAKSIKGLYSSAGKNTFIEPISNEAAGTHILYEGKDMIDPFPFSCATDDKELNRNLAGFSGLPRQELQSCKTVRMYLEVTHGMYTGLGGTVDNAVDYALGLFNITNVFFKNEGINLQLSEIYLWNTPDIYVNATGTLDHLSKFRDRLDRDKKAGRPFNGDIAHSLTGSGYGSAAALGDIRDCIRTKVAVSTAVGGPYDTLPIFSFSVYIFAHETGHQLGSPHTHSCLWPGGPIDNCASPEGFCSPGPPPVGGGTIMSYCRSSAEGVNFSKGIGPLPGALIRSIIDTASCLQPCSTAISCQNFQIRNITSSLTSDSLLIRWKKEAIKYNIKIRNNTSLKWRDYEVTNTDSLKIVRTNCEAFFECSIASFCSADNKYGTATIFTAGNPKAIRLTNILPGTIAQREICPGDSTPIILIPDTTMTFRWYRDSILQPQFTTRNIRVSVPGKYSAIGSLNGCNYESDSMQVNYRRTIPVFEFQSNGLAVTFTVTSAGCNKRYKWSFGHNGATDTGRTAVYNYPKYGKYTVTLTGYNAFNNPDSVTKEIIIYNEITDSLNNKSELTPTRNITFKNFSCQQVAYFEKMPARNSGYETLQIPSLSYYDNYGPFVGNTSYPAKGTIEWKIWPVSGATILPDAQTPAQVCDTAPLLGFISKTGKSFQIDMSTRGGIRLKEDTFVTGSIAPGITGPLQINQWNTIGLSYGDSGIHLLVNGIMVASKQAFQLPPYSFPFSQFTFGFNSILDGISNTIYYWQFVGAIDKVRFSFKEKNFTFSAYPAWQGTDTMVLNKSICYGSTFNGYDKTGVYYTTTKTKDGCDSVTKTILNIASPLSVEALPVFVENNKPGAIELIIKGGLPPYKVNWSNGSNSTTLSDLTPGIYSATIEDSIGCRKTIIQPLYKKTDGEVFRILPNPMSENGKAVLQALVTESGTYKLTITDNAGRRITHISVYLQKGINHSELDFSLSKGVHFFTLRKQGILKKTIKIIVH